MSGVLELICQGEYLIILDGLEEMQKGEEKGEEFGCMAHRECSELLRFLADARGKGLCLITTRYPLKDIENYQGTAYQKIEVERLEIEDARALFARVGVKGEQEEMDRVISEYAGHALSLTLLAKYLKEDFGGDIKKVAKIPPFHSDKEAGGKAHRILLWYEKQLDPKQRVFMKIFSLFRREVRDGDFEGVFRARMETEMNQVLIAMPVFSFKRMVDNLCDRRLISKGQETLNKLVTDSSSSTHGVPDSFSSAHEVSDLPGESQHQDTYATHPLIKAYFDRLLRNKNLVREAHNMLR